MLRPVLFYNGWMIFIFIVLHTQEVLAMSIFDAGKVCLFSKISGTITLDGKPAAHAVVIRKVNLNRDKVDQTTTDENGYFEMPAVFQRTVTKFLPQEFVAKQDIKVIYNNTEYEIWNGVKRKSGENVESKGHPLIVSCELNLKELVYKSVDGSPIFSRCVWDAEGDKPYEGSFFDE
jgi:hypothetical protein